MLIRLIDEKGHLFYIEPEQIEGMALQSDNKSIVIRTKNGNTYYIDFEENVSKTLREISNKLNKWFMGGKDEAIKAYKDQLKTKKNNPKK